MRFNKFNVLIVLTWVLFGCSDHQSKRTIGASIEGAWAFGPNPNCEIPKAVVTISDKIWSMLNPKGQIVELIEMGGIVKVNSELLIPLEFKPLPELIESNTKKLLIYFEDTGNKLSAVALHLNDSRVPLEVMGISKDTAPFYWLTKC